MGRGSFIQSRGKGQPSGRQKAAACLGASNHIWPSHPFSQEHRGLLTIRYPMEHGVVRDWNDMERIWQYVYSKDQLQTFSEEVWQPVLTPVSRFSG